MKYLLCLFALVMPGMSLAAIDAAQLTGSKPEVAENSVKHRPVIEVKFVLLSAPRDQQVPLHGDLASQRSAIEPFSLSGRDAVPLGNRYWNPNSYSCDRYGCINSSQ